MPGMSGVELVRQARSKRPELRVVHVTGNPALLEPDLPAGDLVVAKPYRTGALLGAVRNALPRSGA